jgi:hypothetical protein
MTNILDDQTQQQIRALGRLGWTFPRIGDPDRKGKVEAGVAEGAPGPSSSSLRWLL